MEFSKRIKVNNVRNVLVQIPSAVVCVWGISDKDMLEVKYSDETRELIIKPAYAPAVRDGSGTTQ